MGRKCSLPSCPGIVESSTGAILTGTSRLLSRVASARADVGVRTRRVTEAVTREEDLTIQDTALKSQLQDLDYTEAAVRFASLQQQLQAALTTAAQTNSLSLLDFLR